MLKKSKNNFKIVTDVFFVDVTPGFTSTGRARTHEPIFVQFTSGDYKNWIVALDDFQITPEGKMTFIYLIKYTPKELSLEDISEKQEALDALLDKIFPKILDQYLAE